jgi:uncharacterized membrane protein
MAGENGVRSTLYPVSRAIAIIFVGAILIPVSVGLSFGVSPGAMMSLVTSVIIFQALAAVIGLGLNIPPGFVLAVMTSVALTVILTVFEICDAFAHRSTRVQGWIAKMKDFSEKSDKFNKYGELALLPIIWIPGIGLYGCALIAWIFQWRGVKAIGPMLIGWIIASLVVMIASLGLISIMF